jgi:hypothetical protein
MKSNVTAKFQWTSALLSALFVGPASVGSVNPEGTDLAKDFFSWLRQISKVMYVLDLCHSHRVLNCIAVIRIY